MERRSLPSAAMSISRPVFPGFSYLITRRCEQRQFLLVPLPAVTQAFYYCLGIARENYEVSIHALCAMSSHYHLVLTDTHGILPKFMGRFNTLLARCLNAFHQRWGCFFEGTRRYSRAELGGPTDVLDKMVYTLANPVQAGLVSRGSEWPGARSGTLRDGRQLIIARRPRFFFSENMPEEVELPVEPPPESKNDHGEDFGEVFHQRVMERELEIRREFKKKRRKFLGPRRVLGQSPTNTPLKAERRRVLDPNYAIKDKWQRIERLQRHQEFLKEYAVALKKFCAGIRDVIFPAGTWWMRVHHGVACRAPP